MRRHRRCSLTSQQTTERSGSDRRRSWIREPRAKFREPCSCSSAARYGATPHDRSAAAATAGRGGQPGTIRRRHPRRLTAARLHVVGGVDVAAWTAAVFFTSTAPARQEQSLCGSLMVESARAMPFRDLASFIASEEGADAPPTPVRVATRSAIAASGSRHPSTRLKPAPRR